MTRPSILLRLLAEGPMQESELRAICGWTDPEFTEIAESLRQAGAVVPSSDRPSDARLWAAV